MIARRITDVRQFMSGLLSGTLMDGFLLAEGSVTTFCTFSVDGTFRSEFYSEEHLRDESAPPYVNWADVREYVYGIIRGKHTPLSFQFTFALPEEEKAAFVQQADLPRQPEEIAGLYLNLRFDGKQLTLTTASSLVTFIPDKSHDRAWDAWVLDFLDQSGISCEELS